MQVLEAAPKNPRFDRFLSTLRADETRKNYGYIVPKVVGEPDAFLALAETRPLEAEDSLIDWILGKKGKLAGSTIYARTAPVKSFLDFNGAGLNWSKLRKVAPQAIHVGRDRAPTLEELRKLLSVCSVRERAIVLIMVSSGIRIGAFDWLRLGHVKRLDNGAYKMKVYPGEPQEYDCFFSPEGGAALEEYLASRERTGERLGPESPLIRDKWFAEYKGDEKRHYQNPSEAIPMTSRSLKALLRRQWIKCGLKTPNQKSEFKIAHGTRKYFKTQATRGVGKELSVEVLMGHKLNYFKPTEAELFEEYMKAVPYLTVGESYQLKQELETTQEKHGRDYKESRFEILDLKDRYEQLEKDMRRVSEILDQVLTPEGKEALKRLGKND